MDYKIKRVLIVLLLAIISQLLIAEAVIQTKEANKTNIETLKNAGFKFKKQCEN